MHQTEQSVTTSGLCVFLVSSILFVWSIIPQQRGTRSSSTLLYHGNVRVAGSSKEGTEIVSAIKDEKKDEVVNGTGKQRPTSARSASSPHDNDDKTKRFPWEPLATDRNMEYGDSQGKLNGSRNQKYTDHSRRQKQEDVDDFLATMTFAIGGGGYGGGHLRPPSCPCCQ